MLLLHKIISVASIAAVAAGSDTSTRCYTVVGPSLDSSPLETQLSTVQTPCFDIHTSTVIENAGLTNAMLRESASETNAVTVSADCSTQTVTTTDVVVITSTSTEAQTVTSTSTSTTTLTVAAPSNFLPIQSTLPESTWNGTGGPDPAGNQIRKRRAAVKSEAFLSHSSDQTQSEVCQVLVPGKCAPHTVTVTSKRSAQLAPITGKSAVTVTSCHDATKTVTDTVTATSTSVETVSASTTSTETIVSVTATKLYEACATNNFASYYEGAGICAAFKIYIVHPGTTVHMYRKTPYDCCAAMLEYHGDDAAAFFWDALPGSHHGICSFSTFPMRPGTQQRHEYQIVADEGYRPCYVLGNGLHGSFITGSVQPGPSNTAVP